MDKKYKYIIMDQVEKNMNNFVDPNCLLSYIRDNNLVNKKIRLFKENIKITMEMFKNVNFDDITCIDIDFVKYIYMGGFDIDINIFLSDGNYFNANHDLLDLSYESLFYFDEEVLNLMIENGDEIFSVKDALEIFENKVLSEFIKRDIKIKIFVEGEGYQEFPISEMNLDMLLTVTESTDT